MNYFIYTSHQSIVPWLLYQSPISFLEPTCLLVSTKTNSNQFPGSKILEVSVSRRMRELVYTKMASRDKVDVDAFHKDPQRHSICIGKTRKSKFDFERAAVSNFKSENTRTLGTRLWLFQSSVSWCWPKGTWALGKRLINPMHSSIESSFLLRKLDETSGSRKFR